MRKIVRFMEKVQKQSTDVLNKSSHLIDKAVIYQLAHYVTTFDIEDRVKAMDSMKVTNQYHILNSKEKFDEDEVAGIRINDNVTILFDFRCVQIYLCKSVQVKSDDKSLHGFNDINKKDLKQIGGYDKNKIRSLFQYKRGVWDKYVIEIMNLYISTLECEMRSQRKDLINLFEGNE